MHSDDEPIPLTSARTEFEANVIAQALRSRGIDARVVSIAGAILGPYIPGQNSIQILVRRDDINRAREALKNTREDSVDIAWDELDVGESTDPLATRKPLGVRRWMRSSTLGVLLFSLGSIAIVAVYTPIGVAVIFIAVFLYLLTRFLAPKNNRANP